MCKKSLTLAAFLAPMCLVDEVAIITLNDNDNPVELYRGTVEDLDPHYYYGKNPTWMKLRGMHVDFFTVVEGVLYVNVC